ncbi:hypothetical protein ACFY9F_35325 [Streptomyces sp. NPDC012421]|uniref:hypothetical protein n=1 Tax=Streptomyces sp. NPDC012421 TaxID=3364832 RepID=UPI0036E7C099
MTAAAARKLGTSCQGMAGGISTPGRPGAGARHSVTTSFRMPGQYSDPASAGTIRTGLSSPAGYAFNGSAKPLWGSARATIRTGGQGR